MMRKYAFIGLVVVLSCSAEQDPQALVDQAITTAGGDKINNKEIEFEFRGREYGAQIKDGVYEYVRLFKDSTRLIRDVLNNDGFTREINGEISHVPDTMAAKYSNSVNSVIYFALLPYGLNDPAVTKEYLGEKAVKDQTYHRIKVTFGKENGGKDFEDIFIYWINKETNKVDYLAYSYKTDGGGIRFREAYNERYVGGIRFVDYVNYKPKLALDLYTIDEAFASGQLEELSRIELENIQVNPSDS